jgi:putative ABC transport system substrate-binding protein
MNMRRRSFLGVLGGAVAWPVAASGQVTRKVWRIGALETLPATENVANFGAFRQALHTLGYIEGQNLVIEYRSADGRPDRFPTLAAELVALGVDLILTRFTPAAIAAKNATKTIPIVMTATADPFSVVSSISHPGGNITGLTSLISDVASKRVELLRELAPSIQRIGYITDTSNPTLRRSREEVEKAAATFKLQVDYFDIRKTGDIEPAFISAREKHVDGMLAGLDAVTLANRDLIVGFAATYRMPSIYASREFVKSGGLISFGVDYPDLYRRAAVYVDKIFKGANPGNLPVEQPTKFEFLINLKTAKALGLKISESFLLRADEVIE